jgi:protein SCO1/2
VNVTRALQIGAPLAFGLALLLVLARPVTGRARLAPPDLALDSSGPERAPSLYRLGSSWLTDDERPLRLAALRGQFQVLALIFTRCPNVCPTLVHDLARLQRRMPERVARVTHFTLVSIDPEHDTPEVLRAYRQRLGLSSRDWTLLRGTSDDVRELGATLGFGFATESGAPSAHSKLVTLLGPDGAIIHQQAGLDADPDRITQLIAGAL